MDNASGAVLNRKCHQFEQLYHGSINGQKYCLGNNVSKEYMCPLVSSGRLQTPPLNPWFSEQSKCKQKDGMCGCHQKMPLLGKYHLCGNQPNDSHYQEDPFQRGQFYKTPTQGPKGQKIAPKRTNPSQQQQQKPQQQQQKPPTQKGGYIFTVVPGGYDTNGSCENDPYKTYPAQQGYYVKRCVGDRNLHPSRQETAAGYNQPIPFSPSKPPVPPLARKMKIESTRLSNGPQVSVAGWSPAMDNLVVGTPSETTNRYILNSNITPSYYPDMVYDNIGKRPVYTARNLESDIPEIILKSRDNLVDHDAGCYQPQWKPRCI